MDERDHDSVVYDDGFDHGYEQGYEEGYDVAKGECEREIIDAQSESYEDGYADGERMLYSVDNPLEVIADMEYDVNLVLTHPESYSAQDCLETIQKQMQRLLRDWGQYVSGKS